MNVVYPSCIINSKFKTQILVTWTIRFGFNSVATKTPDDQDYITNFLSIMFKTLLKTSPDYFQSASSSLILHENDCRGRHVMLKIALL